MSEKVRTVVLAFYSRDEGYAEQAFRSLQETSVKVQYFRADGGTEGSASGPDLKYSSLRLSDEELIAADAEPTRVQAVVKNLRAAGEPAIFFARSDSDAADSSGDSTPCNWKNILVCLNRYEAALTNTRVDLIEAIRVDHTITESA